jgi:pyruvate formate lyase activating enzyme
MVIRTHERCPRFQFEAGAASGIVFDIQRFSVHDGPGIRTTVFFKSCPLRCAWCSNPESQRAGPELVHARSRCIRCGTCVSVCPTGALRLTASGIAVDRSNCLACDECSHACPTRAMRIAGRSWSVEEILAQVSRDAIFYRHSGGGMTLSGGEPLCQPDFSVALLRRARAMGFHTAVETAGWAGPRTVRRVLGEADLILYDVKHLDPARHLAGTGRTNERIVQNARLAAETGVDMVVRVPVIPGFNDNVDDILAIGRFTVELGLSGIHLLPYHRYGAPKYGGLGRKFRMADASPPSRERMAAFRVALAALGLRSHIGG